MEKEKLKVYQIKDNKHGDYPVYIDKWSSSKEDLMVEKHMHNYIQLCYITRGSMLHLISDKSVKVVAGDIFVVPPMVAHGLQADGENDCEVIEFEFELDFIFGHKSKTKDMHGFFDFAYIEPFLVSETQVKPRLNLTGAARINVENILNNIIVEFDSKESGFLLAIKALVLTLLVFLGRESTRADVAPDERGLYNWHREAIGNAMEYIKNHFTEDITIEKVSRIAMISQSYFSYLFKSISSKTFIEYLTELRINEAMRLLVETNQRVVEVCLDCGFKNINHFNRTFKATVGVTPLQYRKANRK